MFSTFIASNEPPTPRRQMVGKACVECRRRKTKCSGVQPCSGCVACDAECVFPEVGRRRVGGRKKKSNARAPEYTEIYTRLFGDIPVESLQNRSRSELLEVISSQSDSSPSEQGSDQSAELRQKDLVKPAESPPLLEAATRLRQLQVEGSLIREWDETLGQYTNPVGDNANALALSLNGKSSYVGISSVMIALRALAKVLPEKFCDQPGLPLHHPPGEASSMTRESIQMYVPTVQSNGGSSSHDGQRLIDAYFATLHVFAPIIHEPTFRNEYLLNARTDAPWFALLNMVFALGVLSLSEGDSDEDIHYYQEAHRYLTLESLGWGSLETLQALILMGGLYLHYRSRPNMASALMGASYRLACALGLHHDNSDGSSELPSLCVEVKRRTWWSIYVLDAWGTVTLGRPSVPPSGSIEPPRNILDDEHGEVASTEPTIHSPLIHNIALCQIITRIQDRLLISPVMSYNEVINYDHMLTSWFDNLPSFLRSDQVSTPGLHDTRVVLKWRYQNIRILLHRPYILDAVIRHAQFCDLSPEEQSIVQKCRDLAADAISTIQCAWRPNKVSCWNGVWFLFQACLIPIMALAVEPPECEAYPIWYSQVKSSIAVCKQMAHFTRAGEKTSVFLDKVLLAITQPLAEAALPMFTGDLQLSLHSIVDFLPGEWDQVFGEEFLPVFNPAQVPFPSGIP